MLSFLTIRPSLNIIWFCSCCFTEPAFPGTTSQPLSAVFKALALGLFSLHSLWFLSFPLEVILSASGMKQHYPILFLLFISLVTALVNLFSPNKGFSQNWNLCPFSQLLILSLLKNISIFINPPTIISTRMTPRSLAIVDFFFEDAGLYLQRPSGYSSREHCFKLKRFIIKSPISPKHVFSHLTSSQFIGLSCTQT